ncbi:lysophospholipid acyltransferase family protein [Chrysiogenes arsenatis]|uniref:lysophospholipid acyltransferase family protein n=1 Tax=Chrysiogenes arsenatis TaxID=309797 RepID=UPI00041984BE|nr:lysophospholipid acyltransferase family protein [Chrysiogenes arsenatis]
MAAKNNTWSSRSFARHWQHQIFYLFIKIGGQPLAYALLYVVSWYYVLFSRTIRQRTYPYLHRRLGRKPRIRESFALCHSFGKTLVDRAIIGILGGETFQATLHGREELLALLQEEKGLLLMTAHVGCWQGAMSALESLGKPVNLLMQKEAGDVDRHYFEHQGKACPYTIIDPRGFLGGTLEILQALKRGEVVSVMGDRMLGNDRNSMEVKFLGETILLPFSAYKLASASQAPIAVLLSAKTEARQYELTLYGVIRVAPDLPNRPQNFIEHGKQFAAFLEDYCDTYPYQFYNFYDLWRK